VGLYQNEFVLIFLEIYNSGKHLPGEVRVGETSSIIISVFATIIVFSKVLRNSMK